MEPTNSLQSDQSYHPKHHIKVYVWIGLIVASLGVAVNGYFYFLNLEQGATPVACTMEAKLCPDGTAVGRTGPNCEFAECPKGLDTSTWKTYTNTQYGFEFKYPADSKIPEDLIYKYTNQLSLSLYNKSEPNWIEVEMLRLKENDQLPVNKTLEEYRKLFCNELRGDELKNIFKINNYDGWQCFRTFGGDIGGFVHEFYLYSKEYLAKFNTITPERELSNEGKNNINQILSTFRFIDTQGTGTLSGKVSIGPNCPVEREGVVCTPSPEAYASREFIVLDSNQKEVTRFYADANGDYAMSLLPGTYTVESAKTGMGYMSKDLPNTINIKAGQSTILNINIDTGIR